MDRTKHTGFYFHIPFCRSKCPYCDFYSAASRVCSDEYIDSLIDEINTFSRVEEFVKKEDISFVDTIYFGGGTPSLMTSSQLESVLSAVRENFSVTKDAEITVECNPSSEGLCEFLQGAKKSGVNRISLGMQSALDSERKALGRKGTRESVENAVSFAKKTGIENISLDVMVGVPESTTDTLRNTLDFALSLDVPHISAYMLKIEEGTFYYKNIEKLSLPTEDETADMYLFMSRYLREKGFIHYEISNFCKEGFHSRHNMKYWDGAPYIGFGPSAHSFFGSRRFYFINDTLSFINGEKGVFDGEGGDEEERLMLSLRTYKGISLDNKNDCFLKLIKNYIRLGLGEEKNGNFVLTPEGMLISNSIILQLTEAL